MSDPKDTSKAPGYSRRGFLKGIGLSGVATGMITVVETAKAATKEASVAGPGNVPISLKINGEIRQLSVEPRVTLLDALRNRLDLTGAKKVCDRGTCGACTVIVDGHPVYSCSMLAIEAEGKEITTIEGIGTPDKMSPVQREFVKNDGQQCGFCTPGFVMACTAFVRGHPNCTIDEARAGLGGNLCRCGTYAGIMLAAVAASKEKGVA
jgi:xanthine dehydrogenase YagT iron-sulfur-binding subunit